MPTELPRRTVLLAAVSTAGATAAVAAVSGCTASSPGPSPTGSVRPSVDEQARRVAAQREQALSGQAGAVLAAAGTPRAAAAHAAVAVAAHNAHAAALLAGLPAQHTSATPSTPSATAPGFAVTVAALVRAEVLAVAGHQDAIGPLSGPVARLIASVAAGDAAVGATLRGALA